MHRSWAWYFCQSILVLGLSAFDLMLMSSCAAKWALVFQ